MSVRGSHTLPFDPGCKFLRQFRFANASLPREDDHVRQAACSPSPYRLELYPLLLPAYQRCSASSRSEWTGRGPRRRVRLQERFVGLARGLTWLCCQFVLHGRDASVVDAQRCGTVTAQGIEAHQVTIGCLVQRFMAQELLSYCDSGIIFTLLFQECDQLFS